MSFNAGRAAQAMTTVRARQQEVAQLPDTPEGYAELRRIFQESGRAVFNALQSLRGDPSAAFLRERIPTWDAAIRDGVQLWETLNGSWREAGPFGAEMEERRGYALSMLNMQYLLLQLSLEAAQLPTRGEYNAIVRARVLGHFAPLWESVTSFGSGLAGGAVLVMGLGLLFLMGKK